MDGLDRMAPTVDLMSPVIRCIEQQTTLGDGERDRAPR